LSSSIKTLNVTTGELCTIAGIDKFGYADTGNPLNFPVTLSNPNGIVVGSDGTVYVTENGNNVIRSATGVASGMLNVQTFAGSWMDMTNLHNEDKFHSTKIGIDGLLDGPASQALMRTPDDIVIAPDGTMYFADSGNSAIRKIVQTPNGPEIITIAGNGVPGFFDGLGASSAFDIPTGLALSPDGAFLYVADFGNNVIRRIDLSTNVVLTYAGSSDQSEEDGPASLATFDGPIGLAVDTDGTLYVSDFAGKIRKVNTSGIVSTVAGSGNGDRDGAGVEARFKHPRGIALDSVNRILYVADFSNVAIRSIHLQ